MTQRLTGMAIDKVSLVDRGANGRPFAVLKRDEEGSMTDPAQAEALMARYSETPAGLAGWLRKAADLILGKPEPVVKGAVPTTDAAMRSHLAAKTPAGHGMGDIAVANMSMAAMTKKHTADSAGADHSHTVAKAQTFAEVVAGQELTDALSDSFYTLQDVLWSAIYAYDEAGQALTLEAKTALVAQDLDEFKSYLLGQMADVTVAKSDQGTPDQRRLDAIVRKVGKKITASRLVRLNAAAEALNSVLAEVADVVANEAATTAEEVPVDKAELIAAFTEAMEPISKRLEALEKTGVVKTEPDPGEDDALTLEGVASAVEKLADAVAEMNTAQGVRKSLAGQDGSAGSVKKSVFAGIM